MLSLARFALVSPEGQFIDFENISILSSQSKQIEVEFRLQGSLRWSEYHKIETQKLFQFDPEIQGRITLGQFNPTYDVVITLLLDPSLVEIVAKTGMSEEQFLTSLEQFSQEQPHHPLLNTENWLLLSAEQKQPKGVVRYRTVWDYFNWQAMSAELDSESDFERLLMEATIPFLQDSLLPKLAGSEGSQVNEEMTETTSRIVELLFEMSPGLATQDKSVSQNLGQKMSDLVHDSWETELSMQLKEVFTKIESGERRDIVSSPLLVALTQFFEQEQWLFTPIPNQPILYLKCQGQNGQWECFSIVQEESDRILFYSVVEQKVPENKYPPMAELIGRINSGLPVGNFELNFSNGEVRCKTSLETPGSFPTLTLLNRLAYHNIGLMDNYIPAIIRVINTDISPQQIMAEIEM